MSYTWQSIIDEWRRLTGERETTLSTDQLVNWLRRAALHLSIVMRLDAPPLHLPLMPGQTELPVPANLIAIEQVQYQGRPLKRINRTRAFGVESGPPTAYYLSRPRRVIGIVPATVTDSITVLYYRSMALPDRQNLGQEPELPEAYAEAWQSYLLAQYNKEKVLGEPDLWRAHWGDYLAWRGQIEREMAQTDEDELPVIQDVLSPSWEL